MNLNDQLHDIGLKATGADLDDILAHAAKKRWSPTQLLEHIAELETKERARRSLERRLARSRLGRFKPIADFDWNWPKKIDRDLVESCLRLDFIEPARNVVLVAPHGLGKSMVAKNIAHEAITAGYSVTFTTASALLLDLASRDSARTLDRRLKYYAGTGLLVIDEIGYLAYDNRNADLLFQLVNLRYEKKSIVFTTNLAFRDWPTIFPNATCATVERDGLCDPIGDGQSDPVGDGQSDPVEDGQSDPIQASSGRPIARLDVRRRRGFHLGSTWRIGDSRCTAYRSSYAFIGWAPARRRSRGCYG